MTIRRPNFDRPATRDRTVSRYRQAGGDIVLISEQNQTRDIFRGREFVGATDKSRARNRVRPTARPRMLDLAPTSCCRHCSMSCPGKISFLDDRFPKGPG